MEKIDFADYAKVTSYIDDIKQKVVSTKISGNTITTFSAEGKPLYCIENGIMYTPDFEICLGLDVTGLEDDTADVTNVNIKEGTKIIAAAAFEDFAIKKVILPKSVEVLGDHAFENSTVKSINLENVLNYGYEVFSGSFIKEAVINKNAKFKEIPHLPYGTNGIFHNCIYLENLNFGPQSVPYGFCTGCVSLKNVAFPNGVEEIGKCAFEMTSDLKNIEFPSNLILINNSAFAKSGLKKVVFPVSLENIGIRAFEKCSSLKDVFIPFSDHALRISDFAFADSAIKDLIIPENVNFLGEAFALRCKNLKTLHVNASVHALPIHAAAICPNLSNVKFNDHIEVIGFESLMKTAITKIDDRFKNIKEYKTAALADCNNLNFVYIPKDAILNLSSFGSCPNLELVVCETKYFNGNPFYNSNKNLVVIAPCVEKEDFLTTPGLMFEGLGTFLQEVNSSNIDLLLKYMSFKDIMKLPVKENTFKTLSETTPVK